MLVALLLQSIISNATRWDTFEHLLSEGKMPRSEQKFRERYKKSPSFLSIHMGVQAAVTRRAAGRRHVHGLSEYHL